MMGMASTGKYENPRNEKDFKLAKVVFPSFLLIALMISVIMKSIVPSHRRSDLCCDLLGRTVVRF